jgi:hypothetical protein
LKRCVEGLFQRAGVRNQAGTFRLRDQGRADGGRHPRPSLEERYGTHETYVAKIRAATARLVRDRFLMPDDAERLVREADASNILR